MRRHAIMAERNEDQTQNEQDQNQQDQQNQDESQNQTSQDQSQSPQTPQTNNQQGGNTDNNSGRYIQLLEEQLREQNRQIQNLNSQMEQRQTQVAQAPQPTTDELKQRFYNDPHGATRDIIREELKQAIQPLQDFTQNFRSETQTERLLTRFKADPRFAPMWDSNIEETVTALLRNVAPASINEQTIQAAIVNAIGLKAVGMLPGGNRQPVNNNSAPTPNGGNGEQRTENRAVPPAHMRPSAPPSPSTPAGGQRVRQLTEGEKRLARENRMTDQEYLYWLDRPSDGVATGKFDTKAPNGGR